MIFGNGYRFALLRWKLKTYNLRVWRNGRRTSLRSWRVTVQVQVLSPALFFGLSPSGKAQDFDSCISLVRIQLAQLGSWSLFEYGILAQAVEHLTFNQVVRGSNPRCLIFKKVRSVEFSALFFVFRNSLILGSKY